MPQPPRYLDIAPDIIDGEHIRCAFSGVKSVDGYAATKRWLAEQYPAGYRFRRLDERARPERRGGGDGREEASVHERPGVLREARVRLRR